jgi:hypothetical protein
MTKNDDHILVRIVVGGNLATTYSAETDAELVKALGSIEQRFLKKNRKFVRQFMQGITSGRVVEVQYEYEATPACRDLRNAIRSAARELPAHLRTHPFEREKVVTLCCPEARPE